jgi:hypothetical protein
MVNGKSYVRIAEDKTEAWLYLCEPEDSGQYEKHEVMRYLQLNGVKAGINESNVAAMCNKKIYEREVKIASSEKGDPGIPARYEFMFSTEKPKPQIRSDGSVDYKSMSLIQSAEEGQLVAIYHPPVQGTSGRDVTGKFEKLEIHKELKPLTGRGIYQNEEEPCNYYAAQSGKIQYEGDNRLSIVEVYEVYGACDYTSKPIIEFNGDVVIHGNVEAGVVIKAGKSLTIEGVVESAMLSAGGSVSLQRGIQGADKAVIEAGGDVFAEFIEYTKVRAGGNIQSNVILNSRVSADGKVTLTGKKGLIAGGKVHGMLGIECQTVGNLSEIKTTLHTGVMPEIMEKRIIINEEYSRYNTELDDVVSGMAKLLRVRQQTGTLSESLQAHLESLRQRKNELIEHCNDIKRVSAELENVISQSREAKIRINGNVYKGTLITIDNHRYVIDKNTWFMEYSNQNGTIVGTIVVV